MGEGEGNARVQELELEKKDVKKKYSNVTALE